MMASDVLVAVTLPDDRDRPAPAALTDLALRRLRRLEARWSRFLPDSDVNRLNLASGRAVRVDRDTLTLIAVMREAWLATAGAYDPSVLPALLAAGYRASIDDPARVTPVPAAPAWCGAAPIDAIDVDSTRSVVRLPFGIAIDPGGIGKGLAADLTVAALIEAGAAGALVSIGGDMAMAGASPHRTGWIIAVEMPDPHDGDRCALAVSAGGVATSSTRSRRWESGAAARHHVIDPRTARPSMTDLDAATVVAGTGWLAEAHATAALLAGSESAIDYLECNGLTGVVQRSDGPALGTADLRRRAIAGIAP